VADDFIDLLLGNRPFDRGRRPGRRGSGSSAAAVRAVTPEEIDRMRARDEAQATQIAVLRAMVGVLANTLRDSLAAPGSVDASVLDARLEAALEEALLPPDPDAAAVGADPVPADPAQRLVTCVRCRNDVPASMTTWSANGPACDRCPVVR